MTSEYAPSFYLQVKLFLITLLSLLIILKREFFSASQVDGNYSLGHIILRILVFSDDSRSVSSSETQGFLIFALKNHSWTYCRKDLRTTCGSGFHFWDR